MKSSFNKNGIIQEIVIPDDIDVYVANQKSELNDEIWDKNILKPSVRKAMLKIASAFYDFIGINIKIKDIYFTGSMANFNWSLNSDIDIHLILNYESSNISKTILEEYLIAKKTIWNSNRNITIKGFDVELYAKNKESLVPYKGIYSILNNKWIKKPNKNDKKIDIELIKDKSASLMNQIDNALEIKNNSKKVKVIDKIKDKIKNMRNSGLEKNGEYSAENLTFKVLRYNNYLQKLSDSKNNAIDDSLSIDEVSMITESKKTTTNYEFGYLMLLTPNLEQHEKALKKINNSDIYNKEGFGIEDEPHVTVLANIVHTNGLENKIKKSVEDYMKSNNIKNISLKLKDINIFENDNFDVVKFNVVSKDLDDMNKYMSEKFENHQTFDKYQPHVTIAYVKKGKGKKYIQKLKTTIETQSCNFKYSYPKANYLYFTTNMDSHKKITIGIEKGIKGMTPEKLELIKKFVSFVVNRLEIKKPVSVFFHKGVDDYIVTTAAYSPNENSNHIRFEGRALIDIFGSIGHELTHNKQLEVGSYKIGEDVQNIGGWIEDEANAKAGILKKDFAINLGNKKIYDL